MIHARASESLPLLKRYRTLIAHDECSDHSGVRAIGQGAQNPRAQALAYDLDPIGRTVNHGIEALEWDTGTDVTRCAHAAL